VAQWGGHPRQAGSQAGRRAGRLYLCLSFTSTLCIQTPCALTRPCGLDSISRNELRGILRARSLPRWRASRSEERRRNDETPTRPRAHQRRARPRARDRLTLSRGIGCLPSSLLRERAIARGRQSAPVIRAFPPNRFAFALDRSSPFSRRVPPCRRKERATDGSQREIERGGGRDQKGTGRI